MFKYFKKNIIIMTILVTIMFCSTTVLAEEKFAFTKQPVGGTAEYNKDFTITWETNDNTCKYMLQMRDGAGYEWGNSDYVTSPHKENYSFDFKSDYRIMAMCGDDTYYSNPITISWSKPNNITTANLKDIEIGDLPLGYNNSKTYPVSITNTGAYEIISPKLVFGEDYDYCEIIQNKTPHNIKPGETDNTTWSIKPKKGLGIGRYDTYVYLKSENIPAGTSFAVLFWVIESDVKTTYSASVNTIDFGTLTKGYEKQTDKNLIVKATGTGNLSHVRIVRGESNTTFFDIQTNNSTINTLSAGTDSGKNWSIKLRNGLEPGNYSEQIKVYADELKNPVIATVKVKINDNKQVKSETTTKVTTPSKNVKVEENIKKEATITTGESTIEPVVTTGESTIEPVITTGENTVTTTGENTIDPVTTTGENTVVESAQNNNTKEETNKKSNTNIIIIIIASAIVVTAGITIFFINHKKKI